ncbi:MAG: 4Fe-4S dicluster domain-containing protein [Planctomycetes bacterium]|nr:4Fe-4S dicluster domain-containing protein [Planctomycetota bacterium]
MIEKTTDRKRLEALARKLVASGARVGAPVADDGRLFFRPIAEGDAIAWEANGSPVPRNSPKEMLFPATETVLRWRQRGPDVEVAPPARGADPAVILGARPCDARGFKALDALFGWDHQDPFWQARREATTVVSIACTSPDPHCFCTAVGGAPDSPEGSDVLLTPAGGDLYHVEAVTERGERFIAAHPEAFSEASTGEARREAGERARAALAATPDAEAVRAWLRERFDDGPWDEIGLACLGCGACAAVCPTCHCFDLVDEHAAFDRGERRKNWDTCGVPLFTLHASGHNPRPTQGRRIRQRVFHKFVYFFDRFGQNLCTGCGRCGRACPAGIDMAEIVRRAQG